MASNSTPLLESIATPVLAFLTFVGEVTLILSDLIKRMFHRPFELRETINQMAFVGVASVPIVALTAFFSGAVLSLYLSSFLSQYGASAFVGATVGLTVTREVGPVIAGIAVAARCGSAMSAQIGSMAVTEQIDALKMLSVHPTNYLVMPRVVAGITMLPVLALVSMYSGIAGGWIIAVIQGVPSGTFRTSLVQYVTVHDFMGGMVKAPVFGLIITIVACQQGMRTKYGAVGVGNATTNSVVIGMVLVYIANFLIASLIFR